MAEQNSTADAELVILLDEQGNQIGTQPKATVHTAETPYHLAFSCYILNDDGDVLISRRALSKQTWPGVWTNSVCGHPAPGEDFADAIRRRACFELGVDVADVELVLPGFSYRAVDVTGIVEWEKCPVYVARAVSRPQPNAEEVCDWEWLAPSKLFDAVDSAPFAFSQWMGEQLGHGELRQRLVS